MTAIEIGGYYQIQTPQGMRTIKCTSMGTGYIHYGIYSISDYENLSDGQSSSIELYYIGDSTPKQIEDWNQWFSAE